MIWFKVRTTILVPRWWIDVATTVHFYEAILATLAIIVWHFYQVILDPDTYPVNFAFLDGKMSVGALPGRTRARFRDPVAVRRRRWRRGQSHHGEEGIKDSHWDCGRRAMGNEYI